MVRYEIYINQANQHQWRLVAANEKYVCWGEGYSSKQAAIDSINWVKQWAALAPIRDLT